MVPTLTGVCVGSPLTVTTRLFDDGLKAMSEVVLKGPTGGVVWLTATEMFLG